MHGFLSREPKADTWIPGYPDDEHGYYVDYLLTIHNFNLEVTRLALDFVDSNNRTCPNGVAERAAQFLSSQ